jgi:hypothetical protein
VDSEGRGVNAHSMSFDGALLRRGFWLYVWRIRPRGKRPVLYVGRTGDSSSPFASSPFKRIGAHLELRKTAKANSITRCLRRAKIEPSECRYEMVALGPIFPEQSSMKRHGPFRDRAAALEYSLWAWLHRRPYEVIGKHCCRHECRDARVLTRVKRAVRRRFPEVGTARPGRRRRARVIVSR